MFCTKCGNEIPKNAKFCTKCGEQIASGFTPASVNGNTAKGKVKSDKIILIAVIAFAVILVGFLAFNKIKNSSGTSTTSGSSTTSKKSRGYKSYEDLIDALFTAAYDNDVDAVINCFPEEMESYAKTLYNSYRAALESGGWGGDLLNYTTGGFFYFTNMDRDAEYWYEIEETVELDQSDYKTKPSVFTNDRLQEEYGLSFTEAYIVKVGSYWKYYAVQFGNAGYITTGTNSYFEVAKINGKWYVLRLDEAFPSQLFKNVE